MGSHTLTHQHVQFKPGPEENENSPHHGPLSFSCKDETDLLNHKCACPYELNKHNHNPINPLDSPISHSPD